MFAARICAPPAKADRSDYPKIRPYIGPNIRPYIGPYIPVGPYIGPFWALWAL